MAIPKNSKLNQKEKPNKRKESVFGRAFKLTMSQFLDSTTIHGMKHINEPRANKFTKLYWIFIIFTCFVSAVVLMATFLVRYKVRKMMKDIYFL
jgi:hypothetical protein